MSLQNIDIESAMRRLADRQIEDAMREGKFDNLKGAGQPIDMDDAPADENARLTWWALRILKQNDVIPDEVRLRKQIDTLRGIIGTSRDEANLKALVGQANDLIRRLNTLGTNAINIACKPLSLDAELVKLRERLMGD